MHAKLGGPERDEALRSLKEYYRSQRGEELGDLAAALLLGFIEEELAPSFYNRGVRDAKAVVERQAGSLLEELEVLEIVKRKRGR